MSLEGFDLVGAGIAAMSVVVGLVGKISNLEFEIKLKDDKIFKLSRKNDELSIQITKYEKKDKTIYIGAAPIPE